MEHGSAKQQGVAVLWQQLLHTAQAMQPQASTCLGVGRGGPIRLPTARHALALGIRCGLAGGGPVVRAHRRVGAKPDDERAAGAAQAVVNLALGKRDQLLAVLLREGGKEGRGV